MILLSSFLLFFSPPTVLRWDLAVAQAFPNLVTYISPKFWDHRSVPLWLIFAFIF